jgi:hypothetical protein
MTSRDLDGEYLQVVLPDCLKQVLESLHDCSYHQGRARTMALVKRRCYWPGMQGDLLNGLKNVRDV